MSEQDGDDRDDFMVTSQRALDLGLILNSFESIANALDNAAKRASEQIHSANLERSRSSINSYIDEEYKREADQIETEAMETLLKGLKMFRRDFAYWERLAAQMAMSEYDFTQRKTAELLGASTNTTNRWAQNPVDFPSGE